MNLNYRSNGKLLLTGEYSVLFGATALVLPLRYGQSLKVIESKNSSENLVEWEACENGQAWFTASFRKCDLKVLSASHDSISKKLQKILLCLAAEKPEKFNRAGKIKFITDLEFSRSWGWGSSSTLLVNLAKWGEVDPYRLHNKISEGSAYDIAAALVNESFLYCKKSKPFIETVSFNPSFSGDLCFVYLGEKQKSEVELKKYLKETKRNARLVDRISQISHESIKCKNITEFELLMNEHEQIMAEHLERRTIKDQRFSEYPHLVKSLGAWGGDFVLFSAHGSKEALSSYLDKKGLSVRFYFNEININQN